MKIYLVTFAEGEIYISSQKKLDETLNISQIGEHIKWDFTKIKGTNFYLKNRKLLDNEIGFGYWSWKPYIILDKLQDLNEEDILIYMDASRYETDGFKNSCLGVIEFMKKNNLDIIPGFQTKNKNFEMIKTECMNYFDVNEDIFKKSNNIFTSPMFLKKNNFTLKFIKEWLDGCLIEENVSYQDLSFSGGKIHIYDQAVLNCLLYKYKIKSFIPNVEEEQEFRKFTYYFDYFSKEV